MNHAVLEISAVETAYAHLRELIMNVELVPNSHHLESDLAQRLNVDPTALHEAAEHLHNERLVCLEPRGGFWISPIRPADVMETFRQVSRLEARAAYIAALHGASSFSMAALDDAVLRMEDALFRCDRYRWARANHHFHRSLVQGSEHPELISSALLLSERVHRARMARLMFGPLPVTETQDHALLVHAIRRGAAAEARDLHISHWRSAARLVIDLLEENRLDRTSA